MSRDIPNERELLGVLPKIDPKYRSVFERMPPEQQARLIAYFIPRPRNRERQIEDERKKKRWLTPTRPRVIKWYCPFASQTEFPSGHRYCINVYVGCAHGCLYCYAAGYQRGKPGLKDGFRRLIDKDLADLDAFEVPAAPVHLSNSTDPFQPFEQQAGHTRYALEQILAHRHRFTTVTILTKNPLLPVSNEYVELFRQLRAVPADHPGRGEFQRRGLPAFQVQVSLAFWRDEARAAYDLHAPTVEERKEGIVALREAGIPLVLRIDPLLPRSPLPIRPSRTLRDFGLPETQTMEDLENLVAFAKTVGVHHVVYSSARIVQPRGRKLSGPMTAMRRVYQALAAPDERIFRGGSWRLPRRIIDEHVVGPFQEVCSREGVRAKFCKTDLLGTL